MRVFSAGGSVEALAWSADDRYLADARSTAVISVRDMKTGEVIRTWSESKPCHSLAFGSERSLYAHSGKQVVRYTEACTKIFGYQTAARRLGRLQVANNILMTGDGHGMDLASGKRLPNFEPPAWVVDDIQFAAVALAPSGDFYALAWAVDDRRQHTMALALVNTRSGEYQSWLTQGEFAPPDALFFSADSERIYAIQNGEELRIATFGRNPGLYSIPGATVAAIAPSGKHLFCAKGSSVAVYETESWRCVERLEARIDDLQRISISADNGMIALGNATGQIAVLPNERK